MLSGSEEADYLLFCLEKWRALSLRQRRGANLTPLSNKLSAGEDHALVHVNALAGGGGERGGGAERAQSPGQRRGDLTCC